MILIAALFLTTAQVATAAPQDAADEIVVVGKRLKSWRGKATIKGSKASCKTSVSTGDKEIDLIGCQALEVCLPPFQTRVDASAAKGISSAVRKEMVAALNRDLADCVRERRSVLVADLVDRRMEERLRKADAQNN